MPATIRVGTAAWSDHVDFYPPGVRGPERIAYYARHFSVVEVNASFYAVLPQRNYASWVDRTPDDFVFNVKALGQLTGHVRSEPATPDHFTAFRASYAALRESGKLGAVLFQFPPWFEDTAQARDYITWCVDLMQGDPLVVEFRNVTWMQEGHREDTLDFLRNLAVRHVTVDAPQTGTGTTALVPAVTNPDLAYLRIHGRNTDTWYQSSELSGGRFNYNYTETELSGLADVARQLASQAETLHIIFNNNVAGHGIRNARTMMRMLGLEIPESDPVQATLDI